MARWTTGRWVAGAPEDVLALLTEPDAISRWAPIAFEVLGFESDRLRTGDEVRVQGYLVGRALDFLVEVGDAGDGCLSLTATGPITLEVRYEAIALDGGSELRAAVTVKGSGLIGRMLAQATDALLAAGALSSAVGRIGRELEGAGEDRWERRASLVG